MRYFIDTEFVEDGKTIDLISIGVVCQDGRTYYAISSEFDMRKAKNHPFVGKHVLPKLFPCNPEDVKTREQIALDLIEFTRIPENAVNKPEFWGDFCAYDWVALCQLFGPMVNKPENWPYFCNDVQQLRKLLNHPEIQVLDESGEHNALYDARECKARFEYLWQIWLDRLQALASLDKFNQQIVSRFPDAIGMNVLDFAIAVIDGKTDDLESEIKCL